MRKKIAPLVVMVLVFVLTACGQMSNITERNKSEITETDVQAASQDEALTEEATEEVTEEATEEATEEVTEEKTEATEATDIPSFKEVYESNSGDFTMEEYLHAYGTPVAFDFFTPEEYLRVSSEEIDTETFFPACIAAVEINGWTVFVDCNETECDPFFAVHETGGKYVLHDHTMIFQDDKVDVLEMFIQEHHTSSNFTSKYMLQGILK